MSRIGLVDVDGHNFPNFALMRISAYHKMLGDQVEWVDTMFGGGYDKVYMSKIFTFTPDFPYEFDCEVIKGGTGYDVKSRLPHEIESSLAMDYSIYPDCNYSLQFFSRGCIRKCPFCLVRDKEGYIHSVDPVELNPKGEWIEVLDNNFFANPDWKGSIDYVGGKPRKSNVHTERETNEKFNKRGRGTSKTPVIGVKERSTGKVHAVVANYNDEGKQLTGKQLFNVLKKVCKDGVTVMTDQYSGYNILDKENEKNFIRVKVDHSVTYSLGDGKHTNGIESFWAIVKRGVYGVYHHISVEHMQKYMDEFCFRLNHRECDDAFESLVNLAIAA